jgi:hypothetical protein
MTSNQNAPSTKKMVIMIGWWEYSLKLYPIR